MFQCVSVAFWSASHAQSAQCRRYSVGTASTMASGSVEHSDTDSCGSGISFLPDVADVVSERSPSSDGGSYMPDIDADVGQGDEALAALVVAPEQDMVGAIALAAPEAPPPPARNTDFAYTDGKRSAAQWRHLSVKMHLEKNESAWLSWRTLCLRLASNCSSTSRNRVTRRSHVG